MPGEIRTAYYDPELQVEAYRFQGVMQNFPSHFHEHYVIGFIENSQRYMLCNHQAYILNPGDIMIFNPRDIHSCEQIDGKALDYRSIGIQPDSMKRIVREITGKEFLPSFSPNVLYRSELAGVLQELHDMIFRGESDFIKEELFLFLISQLLQDYSDTTEKLEEQGQERDSEFATICDYIESHYSNKRVYLFDPNRYGMGCLFIFKRVDHDDGLPRDASHLDRSSRVRKKVHSEVEACF
ncbi:AraC family ligand binding domain-containing protein [Paenibacillus filicis]|uniref:AraC family ligand binding domain-containing protein n=1 Tax=Paenibacillus filicis TaxID=669464 RepID=A0ABU9DV91_9BACL